MADVAPRCDCMDTLNYSFLSIKLLQVTDRITSHLCLLKPCRPAWQRAFRSLRKELNLSPGPVVSGTGRAGPRPDGAPTLAMPGLPSPSSAPWPESLSPA